MKTHFLCSFGYTCAGVASTTRRERPKTTTKDVTKVTCARCKKMFAGEISQLWIAEADKQQIAARQPERGDLFTSPDAPSSEHTYRVVSRVLNEKREVIQVEGRAIGIDRDDDECAYCIVDPASITITKTREEQLSDLMDEEAAQRREVVDAERNVASVEQRIKIAQQRREGRSDEGRLRRVILPDLQKVLQTEIAELNRVRAQIVMLTPLGMFPARRPQDGRVIFVTVPQD